MANVKVFGKWVKLQGHEVKNHGSMKVLVIKNTHMKSISLTIQKIWPMLIFFGKRVKYQGQGHKVKSYDTKRKVLS
jgi:hypothetical protein